MNFLDTSAILNGAIPLFENIYISPLVVAELENIKNSSKPESIKYAARQAVREILASDNINHFPVSQKKVARLLKKYDFLSDINDHKLLCEALILAEEQPIKFVTSDGSLALFVEQFPQLELIYLHEEEKKVEEWCGWSKYYPAEEQLTSLYTNPELNVLKANINEYCEIFVGNELKDVLFWNGKRYTNLKYQTFKGPLGEKVAPRNLQQKMLFNLLQNDEIKIKLCLGGFGDGKTWSMLQHALKGIKDGRFSKIIYVRNNIITKGSRDIGYLSGSLIEKIKPYILPIADLTSPEYLDELIETEILEPVPLAFMRGRDFSGDVLVFCDEAENLTKENIQLLIGRIGEGSQLWLAGDLKQIDNPIFEDNNGIQKMIKSLKNEELFGMVKLIKSERSRTSQLADLMD